MSRSVLSISSCASRCSTRSSISTRSLGVTVVYVTHDQSEALTMSDRIAVFNDGVIQQLSSPDELYERPLNSFVAQFIGENNKLHGRVEKIDKDGNCSVKLDSGETVKALGVNIGSVGDRTMMSLRPERVEVNPKRGTVPNIMEGRIEELIYLGDHIRTRMTVAGHDDFIVKIPNTYGHEPLAEGSTTKIGWNTADCRALGSDRAFVTHSKIACTRMKSTRHH